VPDGETKSVVGVVMLAYCLETIASTSSTVAHGMCCWRMYASVRHRCDG